MLRLAQVRSPFLIAGRSQAEFQAEQEYLQTLSFLSPEEQTKYKERQGVQFLYMKPPGADSMPAAPPQVHPLELSLWEKIEAMQWKSIQAVMKCPQSREAILNKSTKWTQNPWATSVTSLPQSSLMQNESELLFSKSVALLATWWMLS